MASTLTISAPALPRSEARRPSLARRILDAVIESRSEAAEREVRRHLAFRSETALVQGEFREIGLGNAGRLPFNG